MEFLINRGQRLEVCDEAETGGKPVGARVQRGDEHRVKNGRVTPPGLPQVLDVCLLHLPRSCGSACRQSGTIP